MNQKYCEPCAVNQIRDDSREARKRYLKGITPEQIARRRARRNTYQARRYREDPKYALGKIIIAAINQSIRLRQQKGSPLRIAHLKRGRRWHDLVGWSVEDLRAHLEARFRPGMTWENRGEWHIDHIRPLASFDFNTPDDPEFRQAWALSNLQPLWAMDNLRKGARVR